MKVVTNEQIKEIVKQYQLEDINPVAIIKKEWIRKYEDAPPMPSFNARAASSQSDPYFILAMYFNAINEGATMDDCEQSSMNYYGVHFGQLIAACMIGIGWVRF